MKKNIFNYISKYGNITFDEKEFNDIDNLIFSSISYVPFYILNINKKDKYTLSDLSDLFFKNIDKKFIKKNIIAVRGGIKVLDSIRSLKRYKDLEISNYIYIGNEYTQFSAFSIKINTKLYYIAYEGTDELISSWKEDFKIAYTFPVEAQKLAINYLKKFLFFKNIKVIVGGHSKGGNLALVSSMYQNIFNINKIVKIYNNDGPGLRLKQIESKNYKRIENKLIHIIPDSSIVGLLLRHKNNYKVVDSYESGLLAHDFSTWQIEDSDFKYTELSLASKYFEKANIEWLELYSDLEREEFVDALFDIFNKVGVNTLIDIKEDKISKILALIKESKNIEKKYSDMINNLFKIMLRYFTDDIKNKIGFKKNS